MEPIDTIPEGGQAKYGQSKGVPFSGIFLLIRTAAALTGDDFQGIAYFHIDGYQYFVEEYRCI